MDRDGVLVFRRSRNKQSRNSSANTRRVVAAAWVNFGKSGFFLSFFFFFYERKGLKLKLSKHKNGPFPLSLLFVRLIW